MASFDNLLAYDWGATAATYRSTPFSDTWDLSDLYTKESDTLARAIQSTFTPKDITSDFISSPEMMAMFMEDSTNTTTTTTTVNTLVGPSTPTVSGGSETDASVVTRRGVPAPRTGRVSKRKSRSTKKAMTTFFTADPASFRQMVQQITGINGQVTTVMKPEPKRVMPTLDTSDFFLGGVAPFGGIQHVLQQSPAVDGGLNTAALDFESFCSFPTLESWKPM